MAEEIARRARELGYRTLVLDTLGTMEAAQGLYVSMGFKPATSYYVNPLPNVKYSRWTFGWQGRPAET